MEIQKFAISGLLKIKLKKFSDNRGFFTERFNEKAFLEAGLPSQFVQDNFSRSAPGVLRGVHYQWDEPQSKLVTCLRGRIYDVAVDVRKDSPTFGQHVSVELDGDDPSWFWIPAGFAHGFCVLGDQSADVMYKVNVIYNPKGEAGIMWNDPDFQISWPLKDPVLSPKDLQLGSFQDYRQTPRF
ncbi:MAG: dTDP-4-dehydrorhamnose 3,5-epimerase [Bdellovibrionaceae bacterium]|nr:dTDP-4-dehydrorhamnose 3,5-epimerase [Pseudobdellovibrionaceae bacterium]